jgi:hypothetical protein
MSRRQWALVVVLILINYVVFASLFNVVFSNRPGLARRSTPTPLPTFTPLPSPTPLPLPPTNTPIPPSPTPSPTPVDAVPDTPVPESVTATPLPATEVQSPASASVTVDVNLNVRTGPGTNYSRVGALAAGTSVEIIGRTANSAWWQIPYADAPEGKAWISAGYGTASNTEGVPVVEAPPAPTSAPPPPEAAATTAPPAAPSPEFPYSPLAWEGQWNAGLAQIRGHIRDAAGNPLSGVFVQAKCGSTVLASNPSGVNLYSPGEPYEAGAYDIVLSSPLSADSMCNWEVRVVQANSYDEAKNLGAPPLSPIGYCDLGWEEMSICFADWRKN